MTGHLEHLRSLVRATADLQGLVCGLQAALLSGSGAAGSRLWADLAFSRYWDGAVLGPQFDPGNPLARFLADGPNPVLAADLPAGADIPADLRGDCYLALAALGQVIGIVSLSFPVGAPPNGDTLRALADLADTAAPAMLAARQMLAAQSSQQALSQSADELRVAENIQRSLLPESLPDIPGWRFDARYAPARVIGGDLYDFIHLPGDLLGIVLGDASDKGVPAALVMATTRALIRSAAMRLVLPGQVLAQVNNDLAAQLPPGVYVTCFYAILDTASGRVRYANAGQCAPVVRSADGASELTASGWPLGMLPERSYDEGDLVLLPGNSIICYSDGVSETHDASGQLFGTGRIVEAIASHQTGNHVLPTLIETRDRFAGRAREQEDDLTIISLSRLPDQPADDAEPLAEQPIVLARLSVPSRPDTERAAADQVLAAIADLGLTSRQRERLHTAVAEAVLNAAEHGNQYQADLPVEIEIAQSGSDLVIRISDQGLGGPLSEPTVPDLDAKLADLQGPRGWGLMLIREMVDDAAMIQTDTGLTVQLTVRLEESKERTNV